MEIKCPRSENFQAIKNIGEQAVSEEGRWSYWRCQLSYQLWVSGAQHGHLVIFDADAEGRYSDRLLVFPVERDAAFEKVMLDRLTEFWEEYVLKSIQPPRGW